MQCPDSLPNRSRAAFTLIELSIVIVIIALIVGAVLVGQSLIRASEIRSAIAEKEKFATSVNTFKGKYNCLPGDCPTARVYFGNVTSNGNGDEMIAGGPENFTFWQQLSLGGLIPGSYTGTYSNNQALIGVNVPASKYVNTGWSMGYSGVRNDLFNNFIGNAFKIGGQTPNNATIQAIILPVDAQTLDQKVDDGLPGSGTVITYIHGAAGISYNVYTCATTTDPATAIYDLVTSGAGCTLYFIRDF